MPKGKTNQPLTIIVDECFTTHDEVVELRKAGHWIHAMDFEGVDIIMSPKAMYWEDHLWPYLKTVALTPARRRRRALKSQSSSRKESTNG